MTQTNRRDGVMKRYIDKHGIARKGDKLDIVAMGFENKTTAIFDECLSDNNFYQLFLLFIYFWPISGINENNFNFMHFLLDKSEIRCIIILGDTRWV